MKISVIYIDDDIDESISRVLDGFCYQMSFDYEEILFNVNYTYENLLSNELVQKANIIIIDSKLFENSTASNGKFTGEEFKMILKKEHPYIEVIVISQNGSDDNLGIIAKYKDSMCDNYNEYYNKTLVLEIKNRMQEIERWNNISSKLQSNNCIPVLCVEKILNSLQGNNVYDELKKEDVDSIIKLFQEIKENVNNNNGERL